MKAETTGLPDLPLPTRSLFTGYILVVGVGLLMSGVQILLTHGLADGDVGISVDDIVYSYYGNRSNSKLETKLNGSMQDKAPVDVKRAIIMWAQQGASREEWDDRIGAHFEQYCVKCHSVIPAIPSFKTYEGVSPAAAVDTGETVDTLARVSHIHLFGIAFIFVFVGYIFNQAVGFSPALKSALIITPFAFLLVDVLSWWLTKWYPNFAILTLIGGFGYAVASVIMLFTSLYQMWIVPLTHR
ncbi:MAG: hypothetical protein ACR2PS_12635 [Pseudomonadales bacterium]